VIGKLIDFILREKLLVIAGSIFLVIGGLYAFKVLNIEAYPDPSPPTIEVIAQNRGWTISARSPCSA
jgi:cobalt-zinc-cadmium resistance protein CzcA